MPPHGENCGAWPTVAATDDTHGGSKAWSCAQVVGRGRLMPPHGKIVGQGRLLPPRKIVPWSGTETAVSVGSPFHRGKQDSWYRQYGGPGTYKRE